MAPTRKMSYNQQTQRWSQKTGEKPLSARRGNSIPAAFLKSTDNVERRSTILKGCSKTSESEIVKKSIEAKATKQHAHLPDAAITKTHDLSHILKPGEYLSPETIDTIEELRKMSKTGKVPLITYARPQTPLKEQRQKAARSGSCIRSRVPIGFTPGKGWAIRPRFLHVNGDRDGETTDWTTTDDEDEETMKNGEKNGKIETDQ